MNNAEVRRRVAVWKEKEGENGKKKLNRKEMNLWGDKNE